MKVMLNRNDLDLLKLAKLYLQNEQVFVVRRFVQSFASGELTAQDALARIREHLDVREGDLLPDEPPVR